MLFVIAKLTAPCTGPSFSTWKPVSAYAAAPISSSQTKRLKRSPDIAKPHMRAEDDEHQRVEQVRGLAEEAKRVDQRERDDQADHAQPGGDGPTRSRSRRRRPAARVPASEPLHRLPALHVPQQQEGDAVVRRSGHAEKSWIGSGVTWSPPAISAASSSGIATTRARPSSSRDVGEAPRVDRARRPVGVIASARISAITATLTTTSVSVSACTTGSTAVVPSFMLLKIGALPSFT